MKRLYRHVEVALLRAATTAVTDEPDWWFDVADVAECRDWLDMVWSRSDFGDRVRLASPALADRVVAIRSGKALRDKQVRRTALAVARYLLRSIGRATPFGLFAGVAPVSCGRTSAVRWGEHHRCLARVHAVLLADVIARAEESEELLGRLDVRFSDLAVHRGTRLELPQGPNRVSIRYTAAVAAVQHAASAPTRFAALVDHLSTLYPSVEVPVVRDLLTDLVRQGYLITSLRAPFTVTDPLAHLLKHLQESDVDDQTGPDVHSLMRELAKIHTALDRHNDAEPADQPALRVAISDRMRDLSGHGRTQLTCDTRLDCEVHVPYQVAREMEAAATVLVRLTRHPAGDPVWRAYHAAFIDRYGRGSLVPLSDVLDPDTGLGYPAGYPGSVLTEPPSVPTERDHRLLALAWAAINTGADEVVLTDDTVAELTGEAFDEQNIPPHVELAARVHARDTDALDRGEFTLTITPARAAGTLTSRFTPLALGADLGEVYRHPPVATDRALPVQLSFGPLYPNAENVCRVPAYLDHVLSLGEHRDPGNPSEPGLLTVDDLAITATHNRLHLVSLSRRQVVEPQVFHALDLRKQPPALARFLAHLPRAFTAGWYRFDWGPHTELPRLPRVRYRRSVLAPGQWRLTANELRELRAAGGSVDQWYEAVTQWRDRWRCPPTVELRDGDRALRLNLNEPAHVELLRTHLAQHGHAVLTEATSADQLGWLAGHAHEIALPLITTSPPAPNPLIGEFPLVTNADGHLPGASASGWVSAKLFTHPERIDELVSTHLPLLLTECPATDSWWLRYRGPHETDHIRLRIRASSAPSLLIGAVGDWAQRMRGDGRLGRLVLDTYYPEVGRYGTGAALDAAHAVFAADSRVAAVMLRTTPVVQDRLVLAVANMVEIVRGFFDDTSRAIDWLRSRPVASGTAPERAVARRATEASLAVVRGLPPTSWPADLTRAWHDRADALGKYGLVVGSGPHRDVVLESLLHMHHNRALGINPEQERQCRRLARHVALAWHARPAIGSGLHREATT